MPCGMRALVGAKVKGESPPSPLLPTQPIHPPQRAPARKTSRQPSPGARLPFPSLLPPPHLLHLRGYWAASMGSGPVFPTRRQPSPDARLLFPSLLPPPHLHGQRAGLPHPVPPSGTRLCPSASGAEPPGSRGLAAPLAGYCCGATTRPPALKPPPLPSRHQPTAHLPISRRVILPEFSWEGPPTLFFCLSRGLDAALNSTEEMRFPQTQLHKDTTVGCKAGTPLKRCVIQVGPGHGHIHEP